MTKILFTPNQNFYDYKPSFTAQQKPLKTKNDSFEGKTKRKPEGGSIFSGIKRKVHIYKMKQYHHFNTDFITSAVSSLSDDELTFLSSKKEETKDFINIDKSNADGNPAKTVMERAFETQIKFVKTFYNDNTGKNYENAKFIAESYDLSFTDLCKLFEKYDVKSEKINNLG